jgi:acetyl esterase
MPLDPGAKRFLDRLARLNPPSALELSVEQRRNALADLLGFAGGPALPCATRDCTIPAGAGSMRARLYSPDQAKGAMAPGLVYFHGGGLVAGSIDTHDGICRRLAQASGCRLLSVEYRLAPEHPFPAAIGDGLTATRWAFESASELGFDPDRIAVCGDSAGATLAAVVCQRIAGQERFRPALQILLCPIMDFGAETASRRALGEGYFLERATLRHDLEHYLGTEGDPADPRVSPLRAPVLEGLPPACIHTAEFDPLRDEASEYADRLARAGITTVYRCHPGMIHLFYGMSAVIPYADTAFRLIGADIRSLLG